MTFLISFVKKGDWDMDLKLELDLTLEYEGIEYKAVSILDNNLVLAVQSEELKERKFPIVPVIIPMDAK